MLGLSTGLQHGAGPLATGFSPRPIVAWGDSLSFGYPELAANLFDPPRPVVGQAVGGQTSTQIAARQGGIPVLVTLEGGQIPALSAGTETGFWDFENGDPGGWASANADVAVVAGGLVFTVDSAGDTLYLPLGTVQTGDSFRLQFDLSAFDGIGIPNGDIQVGLFGNSGWINGSADHVITGAGQFDLAITAQSDNGGDPVLLVFYVWTNGAGGTAKFDNIRLTTGVGCPEPVAITARSVSPLTYQLQTGGYRRLAGSILGIEGYFERVATPDDSGNDSAAMTFTRTGVGDAVPCPPDSVFVPAGAIALRNHSAWIWAGRNNAQDPDTVKADIAAMVSHLGHTRYLIGSVLNAASEPVGSAAYATIINLNANLAAIYTSRFVDVRAELLAGHDGSTDDSADIDNGIIPRSLRSDDLHLSAAGQAIAAAAFTEAHLAHRW